MQSQPIIGQSIPQSPPNFLAKPRITFISGTTVTIAGAILHQEALKNRLKMRLEQKAKVCAINIDALKPGFDLKAGIQRYRGAGLEQEETVQ